MEGIEKNWLMHVFVAISRMLLYSKNKRSQRSIFKKTQFVLKYQCGFREKRDWKRPERKQGKEE
jgi:hypothetical protein